MDLKIYSELLRYYFPAESSEEGESEKMETEDKGTSTDKKNQPKSEGDKDEFVFVDAPEAPLNSQTGPSVVDPATATKGAVM